MTWVSLAILLIGYPGLSLLGMGDDPTEMLKNLDSFMLMVVLVTTIIFQWFIFAILYGSISLERTGLAGIGLKRIRKVDFAWAISFFLVAWLLLSGLAWVLGKLGMPLPGEIGLLIPKDTTGRIVWVLVSFTAGFCEEVAFRGYLMTRLRLVAKLPNWVVPTIVSAVAFGACHAYQGLPGFIVITVYGVMFSLLYIRTGSLWPCIIAHTIQDLGALIIPQ